MLHIGADQRRARLGVRHRLAAPAPGPAEVARSLVALHATDPATVYLSVAARTRGLTPGDVSAALYDDRTLLRMLAMRRTMFVVPVEDVPMFQAASADALVAKQRRTYSGLLAKAGIPDAEAFFDAAADAAHAALVARGSATGAQLSAEVPALRTMVDPAPGKSYSRPASITTWVLVTLGVEGRAVRGRPNGSWASSQYVWAPVEEWIPGGIPDMSVEDARAALVRRWLERFGPAPLADLAWWTGWSQRDVKAALTRVDTVPVDLDGTPGLVLADDTDPVPEPEPWAALLPALDPTPMGWKSRDWYLGPHAPSLFDRNGNIGPTLWWNGRVVGGWAQRRDGEIALHLLEDPGPEARTALETAAHTTTTWYGPTRTIPRFRTPLERTLTT
ncbi:winged helix DNA-binding domain-containing protein [Actinomadura flavalba]|uniref:winged helix DNA-binding domain-containing protein n=1 Tax=Actinomadura flavalba TaxID=1120938 RepID=UPI000373B09B|nr:winged helix DNA-binding domain-containing protein [Actinomadura flavalba]